MTRYIVSKNGHKELLAGDPNEYDTCVAVNEEGFDEDNWDCYDISTGSFDVELYREKRKNECREKRKALFAEIDYQYWLESENIYKGGAFKKTPEMDEVMRKKKVLRDLPQQLDGKTEAEIRAFVIPTSLAEL